MTNVKTNPTIAGVREILDAVEYLIEDIEVPFEKRWLKTALVSHVVRQTNREEAAVNTVVSILFDLNA